MVLTRTWQAALVLGIASAAWAGPAADEFARYPARQVHVDTRERLQTTDARSRRYRAALRDAAGGDIDFAGRYILAEVGGGAGCVCLAAIDAPTGRVVWFPATISNWPRGIVEPVDYRADSRLIVTHGQLDEQGSAGPRSFTFDGHRFTALGQPARP